MKFKIYLLIFSCFLQTRLMAQATLVDTFAFEWTTVFNSFWGITNIDDKLYLGADGPGDIFSIDENGAIISSIETDDPVDFNHGMACDGNGFWVGEDFTTGGASLYRLGIDGSVQTSFVLPPLIGGNSSGVGGLSMDGDDLWFSIYFPDFDVFPFAYAYKINPSSQQILDTIPLYGKQVYGITAKGDLIFYVTDDINGDEERIYAYSKTEGDTLFSFPLLDPDGDSSPRGIHWFDDHLWLLAKRPGSSAFAYTMLYKYAIQIGPVAEPQMTLSDETLDFGSVFIGESAEMNFYIKNTGTAPLEVSSFTINFDDFVATPSQALPFTITPGDSSLVTVSFSPSAPVASNAPLTIESNAVLNPVQIINFQGEGILMTYTQNLAEEFDVKIFPNPAKVELYLEYQTFDATSLQINLSSIKGDLIYNLFHSEQPVLHRDFFFDIRSLPQGAYLLTLIRNGKVSKTISFIKS